MNKKVYILLSFAGEYFVNILHIFFFFLDFHLLGLVALIKKNSNKTMEFLIQYLMDALNQFKN